MSVRASLTRVAHDYQGHRVRAIHAISMAIRQLSHRSMNYSGMGFASGMNNGGALGMRQGAGAGALGMRQGAGAGRFKGNGCRRRNQTTGWGRLCDDCRGSTCSSQTRGPIPMGTRGQVGMSNKLSAS